MRITATNWAVFWAGCFHRTVTLRCFADTLGEISMSFVLICLFLALPRCRRGGGLFPVWRGSNGNG